MSVDWEARALAAEAKIAAVERLHFTRGRNILGEPVCNECSPLQPMPCPTLRALGSSVPVPQPTCEHGRTEAHGYYASYSCDLLQCPGPEAQLTMVGESEIWVCIDAKHDVGMRHEDGSLYSATCHDCRKRYDCPGPEAQR